MLRPWLLFTTALLFAPGCPSEEENPASTGDDDSGNSTSGSTDPSASTDPTMGPTNDATSGEPSTDGSSGDSSSDGSSSGSSSGSSGDGSSSGSSGDGSSGDSSGDGSSGRPCDLLTCGGECIDPDTDVNFCGATACEGEDAGQVCVGSATCEAGQCVETCDNCSFETGDFSGWTVVDLSIPFLAAQVMESGSATPTDGIYVAVNGFDGDGPADTSLISFGQDITLREDAASLAFDYRASWNIFSADSLDREFLVRIEPEGGGDALETVLIETATAGTPGDVSATGSVELSAYAGQTVFINFVWTVPETFTGPAQAELDNVRILAE